MPFRLLSERSAVNYTAGLLGSITITQAGLHFFGTEAEADDLGLSPDYYHVKTDFCGKIVALTEVTFDAECVVAHGNAPVEDATLAADAEMFKPFIALDIKSGTLEAYIIPKNV